MCDKKRKEVKNFPYRNVRKNRDRKLESVNRCISTGGDVNRVMRIILYTRIMKSVSIWL